MTLLFVNGHADKNGHWAAFIPYINKYTFSHNFELQNEMQLDFLWNFKHVVVIMQPCFF